MTGKVSGRQLTGYLYLLVNKDLFTFFFFLTSRYEMSPPHRTLMLRSVDSITTFPLWLVRRLNFVDSRKFLNLPKVKSF